MNKALQFIKKYLIKPLLWLILGLGLLLVLLMLAVRTPMVQNWAAGKLTTYFSNLIKHEVKVGYVYLNWFDELLLEKVQVFDKRQNEMIYVGSLRADFDLFTLLSTAEPVLTEVWLDKPKVAMIAWKDNGRLNINELIDAIGDLAASPDTSVASHRSVFHVDKVHLTNGTYSYFDQRKANMAGFDYYHFILDSISAEVDQLRIAGDTFEINVQALRCVDVKTKLRAHEIDVFYRYTSQNMQFERLKAHIGKSFVTNYLEFQYDSTDDLSDFNEKVTLKAHLDSSRFNTDDLALFAPTLKGLNETYTIWTDLSGEVVDINFKNLDLRFGKGSRMQGRVAMKGLPEIDETFVDAKFTSFLCEANDLEKYAGAEAKEVLSSFGRINYKGTYVGFFKDFVAKGNFETDMGNLVSDINIKIIGDEQHSVYQGKISTTNFLLGKLMKQEELVGSIDMEGQLKGVGFSYEHAKIDLNAHIRRIGINHYDYKDVKVEASLAKQMFQGKMVSADTNAHFALNGLMDFSQDPYFMDFAADFKHVNLFKLNILEQPIVFSTKVDLNITGKNLDDFQGDASFSNTFLSNTKKRISLDTLKIVTERLEGERYLNLFSDVFDVNADGNFSYMQLASDLPRLYKEYMLVLENKKEKVGHYYSNASPYASADYRLNFSLLLKKANPVISLFAQENIKVANQTKLSGTFSKQGNTTSFNLLGTCNKLQFGSVILNDSRFNYTSSKNLSQPFVDGSGSFFSNKQQVGSDLKTEDLALELIWNNDEMMFHTSVAQKKNDNHLNLDGRLDFSEGKKEFFFDNIDLKLFKTTWSGDSSRLVLAKEKILVSHFKLKNEQQLLVASGAISENAEDELEMELRQFTLKPLSAALGKDMEGIVNGKFVFSDLLSKNFKLDFDGSVQKFELDGFLIGNISGGMDWKPTEERFDVRYVLKRDTLPSMFVTGYIKPFENNRMALNAHLDRFNLQSFEPFVKDYFSKINGDCTGDLLISGTLLKPNVTGKVHVGNGKFKINFLKTSYSFSHDFLFDSSSIRFSQATLVDTNGNKGYIEGAIKHKRFQNIALDLKAQYKNLLVLNTLEKDNALFYGRLFATGGVRITGLLDDIKIQVNAKNEKNSELYIPISSTENLGGSEFVTFVQKKKAAVEEEEEESWVEKVPTKTTVSMDVDLDPSMTFSLILDKQTGDIIKGTGAGNVKMEANTLGDFSLYGNYVFQKGFYNFTLLNLVNKKFEIDKGSNIAWSGDPMLGILDIKARVEEKASLRDILPEADTAWFKTPAIRKRYPTDVILKLKGNLQQPDISYEIKIKDYPTTVNDSKLGTYPLDNYVRAFQQQMEVNEQQLSRQVFSLLVLRKFFPVSETASGGLATQGAAGTVSSLLSNQLSSWVSQLDENLTVDIDLNGFNSQALNDLRLRLSYQPDFLGGRIRISRDGSFTNAQNNRTASSVAGDWQLEYLITREGTLRLKMFTKNNSNSITNSLNNNSQISTGFSFMHTQSFNNLNDLLRRKKNAEAILIENELVPVEEQEMPK